MQSLFQGTKEQIALSLSDFTVKVEHETEIPRAAIKQCKPTT